MGTLTTAPVKDRYQKLTWFNSSDDKLYKTSEDGNDTDSELTIIRNPLTFGGVITASIGIATTQILVGGGYGDTGCTITNAGALSADGTVTFGSIAEVGSDTDKFLMSDSGVVKYATGSNVLSYIGAQASLTFGISATNVIKCGALIADNDFLRINGTTFEGRNASEVLSDIGAPLATDVLLDTTDTFTGTLTIDKDNIATTTGYHYGLRVDYDHTGTVENTNSVVNRAIEAKVNAEANTGGVAAVIVNTGLYSEIEGVTDGSPNTVQYGIESRVIGGNVANSEGLHIEIEDGGTHINCVGEDNAQNTFKVKVAGDGDTTLEVAGLGATDLTMDVSKDIILSADGGNIRMDDGSHTMVDFDVDSGRMTMYDDADVDGDRDYFQMAVGANGATTLLTNDDDGAAANLTISPDGELLTTVPIKIEEQAAASGDTANYGQIWIKDDTPNTLWFTDDTGVDYPVSQALQTAVWGGQMRTVSDTTWYGIPTGYTLVPLALGTTATAPDTTLLISTTADDLTNVIWTSATPIKVTGCTIFTGPSGSTNSSCNLSLMRYDIDADGDLSSGVEVAQVDVAFSDDYSHARRNALSLSGTAANLLVDPASQILIAAFYEPDAYNSFGRACKVILQYVNQG